MIKLNNVKVQYKDKIAVDIKDEIVLEDAHKIGIIGSNGAGKSTLIKAILGLVNYSGSISSDIPKENIAVHMQFNNYSETVITKDIIQMITNKKIESDSNLMDLIKFFDFEKLLHKSFKKLSGGEKQRISIARMILKNSPIVILDEATAFTDPENESKLQQSLGALSKGKLLLVIAHRLSTIKNADRIFVINSGEIQAVGKHEELLDTNNLYKNMWLAHIGAKNWSANSNGKEEL